MSATFVKQLIALLETGECNGYETKFYGEGETLRVNVSLDFTGTEARIMDAYAQQKLRETDEWFRQDPYQGEAEA